MHANYLLVYIYFKSNVPRGTINNNLLYDIDML